MCQCSVLGGRCNCMVCKYCRHSSVLTAYDLKCISVTEGRVCPISRFTVWDWNEGWTGVGWEVSLMYISIAYRECVTLQAPYVVD